MPFDTSASPTAAISSVATAEAVGLAWARSQPLPQFVVTADLRVHWINDSAAALIDQRGDVTVEDGYLVVRDELRSQGLKAFLSAEPPPASVWVFKRLGAAGYFAVRRDKVVVDATLEFYALTLIATADPDRYVWSDIKVIFGLTGSEADLIKRLIAGKAVQAAAKDMGVTSDTARTHIRNVYSKLGINSREQLFAMMLPFRIG